MKDKSQHPAVAESGPRPTGKANNSTASRRDDSKAKAPERKLHNALIADQRREAARNSDESGKPKHSTGGACSDAKCVICKASK